LFGRERNIRAGDSHGDIVFWPVLALAQYLMASGDTGLLDEVEPFFHPEGDAKAEKVSIRQHAERAISVMNSRVIPGTALAAYGHGDWNDSMQPFDPTMRERLCSAWTVTLHYQTLTALSSALRRFGVGERAGVFEAMAAKVLKELQECLIVDGVIAGYAYFHDHGGIDYLLHPRDKTTGVSYSLLPMIHAVINGLLTPEQAKKHLALIQQHLQGPDGARLFDKPMQYRGGPMKHFQRAESAAFFGREIALMYTHAHLRYAEALACYGDAESFFHALCQANPIGIRTLVPSATLRQANCYYSSSDAVFKDRYQAFAEYDRVKKGEVRSPTGWGLAGLLERAGHLDEAHDPVLSGLAAGALLSCGGPGDSRIPGWTEGGNGVEGPRDGDHLSHRLCGLRSLKGQPQWVGSPLHQRFKPLSQGRGRDPHVGGAGTARARHKPALRVRRLRRPSQTTLPVFATLWQRFLQRGSPDRGRF
ncbi:MAG: uncharacterized protein H6R37_1562, partial [Deltaproteobacteria bacterium]|nr:uncharacterized protein [Deltaproteobacteria bacterium]